MLGAWPWLPGVLPYRNLALADQVHVLDGVALLDECLGDVDLHGFGVVDDELEFVEGHVLEETAPLKHVSFFVIDSHFVAL